VFRTVPQFKKAPVQVPRLWSKERAGKSNKEPAMTINILDYIVSLAQLAKDPVAIIHLALAATHLIIMRSYVVERKRPHAFCAGLSAILYCVLAGLHGVAH
jgi:hypothetical protein